MRFSNFVNKSIPQQFTSQTCLENQSLELVDIRIASSGKSISEKENFNYMYKPPFAE